ncbi:hypothetical protein K3495_g3028 [Podosphaera aphanis]|nr:hypothetical protein K3495_g3028 [Podosphaera aphanis]
MAKKLREQSRRVDAWEIARQHVEVANIEMASSAESSQPRSNTEPHSGYHMLIIDGHPLGLAIFGQLKLKYSKAVDDYASDGVQGITKSGFIDIMVKIRPEVFNKDFVRAAFQAASLSPLNLQVALDRCKSSTQAALPEPEEPSQPSGLTSPNDIDLAMEIDEEPSVSLSPEERLEAMKVQVSAWNDHANAWRDNANFWKSKYRHQN